MFSKLSNRGILFNNLPEFYRISTKDIQSSSDLFVKMMRALKEDPSITHDQQMFRDYRNGDSEKLIRELKTTCSQQGFDIDKHVKELEGYELRHFGAWYGLRIAITSFREAHHSYDIFELDEFFDFLVAHCEIEYLCLKDVDEKSSYDGVEKFIHDWLLMDGLKFPEILDEQLTEYVTKLVMYWAALFDLMMEVWHQTPPTMNNYLPRIVKKKGETYLIPSIEVFLERLKKNWAKEKYQKDDIKWASLYKDILRAQATDSGYCMHQQREPLKEGDPRLIDPNTRALKKSFARLRQGGLLSADKFKSDIAILYVSFSNTDSLVDEVGLLRLINMFTYVQRELCQVGKDADDIVQYFSEYPMYRRLVRERFNRFKQSGVLYC